MHLMCLINCIDFFLKLSLFLILCLQHCKTVKVLGKYNRQNSNGFNRLLRAPGHHHHNYCRAATFNLLKD